MSYVVSRLARGERALEKQESRDRDAARLAEGLISPTDLRQKNGIGSRLPLHRYRISAIGGQPVRNV